MQNTIHPRDLIVGLQKGLALISFFQKLPKAHCCPGGENERSDTKRGTTFFVDAAA